MNMNGLSGLWGAQKRSMGCPYTGPAWLFCRCTFFDAFQQRLASILILTLLFLMLKLHYEVPSGALRNEQWSRVVSAIPALEMVGTELDSQWWAAYEVIFHSLGMCLLQREMCTAVVVKFAMLVKFEHFQQLGSTDIYCKRCLHCHILFWKAWGSIRCQWRL